MRESVWKGVGEDPEDELLIPAFLPRAHPHTDATLRHTAKEWE